METSTSERAGPGITHTCGCHRFSAHGDTVFHRFCPVQRLDTVLPGFCVGFIWGGVPLLRFSEHRQGGSSSLSQGCSSDEGVAVTPNTGQAPLNAQLPGVWERRAEHGLQAHRSAQFSGLFNKFLQRLHVPGAGPSSGHGRPRADTPRPPGRLVCESTQGVGGLVMPLRRAQRGLSKSQPHVRTPMSFCTK